jgi:hypothetical protein
MLLVGTESLAPMELSDLPNPRLVPVDVENDSNASTIHRAAARYRARVERIQAAFEQGRVTGAERNVELGDGLADYRSVGVEVLRERRALIVERRAAISQRGTETERRIEQGADTIGTVAAILNRF